MTLMHTDAKRQLKDARRSTVRVQAANSGVTKGQLDGRIEATTHGAKLNEKVTTMSKSCAFDLASALPSGGPHLLTLALSFPTLLAGFRIH